MKDKPNITRLFQRQVRLSWLALFSEAVVLCFWQPVLVSIFILSLFLLDILPSLGFWLHAIVLGGIGVLFIYFLLKGFASFRTPTRQDALTRLEQSNNLAHSPLRSLDDNLSADTTDSASIALWNLHQAKSWELAKTARATSPIAILAKADPYAIRLLGVVMLMVSFSIAGSNAGTHIWKSLIPDIEAPINYKNIKINAWVTPPAYTNMAPVFLPYNSAQLLLDEAPLIDAPIGALLIVQVSNLTSPPLFQDEEDVAIPFEKSGADSFSYQQEIISDNKFSVVVKDKKLVTWRMILRPDNPPQIAFAENSPQKMARSVLQIAYKAYDDYGVENITLRLRRPPPVLGSVAAALPDKQYEYPVIIPGRGRESIEANFLKDLTPHPWAGTQVLLELIASDALDNVTVSKPRLVVLPQRSFEHPIAREVIKLRTRLTLNPIADRYKVASLLGGIGGFPAKYDNDFAVHLGLRTAALRLIYPSGESEVEGVIKLLWDLALRIENGGLSLAEARLRAAQNAVMEAIANGATQEELSRLMDELEAAMSG